MEALDVRTIRHLSDIASRYAIDNYGELTGIGMPRLDQDHHVVEYPLLCHTSFGILRIGSLSISLDGRILAAPTRDELAGSADDLVRRLEFAAGGDTAGSSVTPAAPKRQRKTAPEVPPAPQPH